MPSPEPAAWKGLPPHAREQLLRIAAASVDFGLANGTPLPVDTAKQPPECRAPGASFVTLRRAGELRGCVGGLEASRPLVESVAEGAFAAAFRDPRFPPLRREERSDIDIHVTVLGPTLPIPARDERELIAQLRPGVDGLVLREGPAQATFLPAVWKSLPEPGQFLAALLRKAGLPDRYWSPDIAFFRYEALDLS